VARRQDVIDALLELECEAGHVCLLLVLDREQLAHGIRQILLRAADAVLVLQAVQHAVRLRHPREVALLRDPEIIRIIENQIEAAAQLVRLVQSAHSLIMCW
jgi:hypothetical protein